MNPEAPQEPFGRTPAAAARAAVILTLLGWGAVWVLVRALSRPGTPVGEAFLATHLPPDALLGLGFLIVLALAGYGYVKSVRSAERYRISETGWEVSGPFLGEYVLEWGNITGAQVLTGGLGLTVRDREAVLRTHGGTERQREMLRTMEPFGEADFLYPAADLGYPPLTVLNWMAPHLDAAREEDA